VSFGRRKLLLKVHKTLVQKEAQLAKGFQPLQLPFSKTRNPLFFFFFCCFYIFFYGGGGGFYVSFFFVLLSFLGGAGAGFLF
jgi:hypothetical protein